MFQLRPSWMLISVSGSATRHLPGLSERIRSIPAFCNSSRYIPPSIPCAATLVLRSWSAASGLTSHTRSRNREPNQERAMGETFPDAAPSVRPPETRLDSWKEIAAYLNRDVTTVQRWEKREGMPVHRHQHDRLGSVYAFSSELDAWVQSRRLRLEEEEQEHKRRAETPVAAEGDHRPIGTPRARRWLVVGGVAVLAVLAVTYVMTRSRGRNATRPKITSLAVLP